VLTNVAKTPVSDEELQLKKKARRRLVGAVVLVLLVVVFVPMFLDREPRPQKQDIDIRIPPIPGQTQAPQAAQPPPAQATAPAVPPPPAAPPAADAAPPRAASATDPAPAPAPAGAAPPPSEPQAAAEPAHKPNNKSTESFVIQVGAFSDPVNARHLVEKLKAQKIPAYTETVKTTQGEKTRVRAGPYATMAAAESGRARLKTLKLVSGDVKIVHKGE
jgi:DedD protein